MNNQPKDEALEFMKNNFVMNIAFSKDNKPSASVVIYYIDDNFNIYFTTHSDSYKAKALQENPQISINVWEHKKMMVQLDGQVEEIKEDNSQLEIVDKIFNASKHAPDFWPPILRIKGNEYLIFKIKPTWVRTLDLTFDEEHNTNTVFTNIRVPSLNVCMNLMYTLTSTLSMDFLV